MRFSEAWLREWVDPDVGTDALAEQLSMAGLEVDSVTPVAAQFEGVYVGAVLSREQHPDADKLGVCTVDVGGEAPLQIVCGAPNVAAGQRVPVALVGAVLPGGFKIKAAKLRGVESRGMICSELELGMADSSEGILVLPNDAPVGEDFRCYMGLDDQAIEVDLTPDRGDCLGLSGIAREVGVINRSPVTAPPIEPVAVSIEERFPVRVEAPAACPRYACRIVRNIDPDAQTPLWMQERLRRSGLRPISPVVDITNYVMLELGQPMHGFDLRQLDTEIQVRMARPGEKLVLLDGQEIGLRDDTLVIADASKAVAMAGIMGGEHSGVARDTVDILFESAFFAPTAIIGKSRSYGLHTDSSHRFERGVDPQLQVRALERATGLLLEMAGGEPGPVVEVVSSEHIEARPQILLRRNRVARVLGVGIDDATISDILTRLEMRVEPVEEGWRVTAPSCRFDINIEEDLIEEVGRIYGYVNIPVRHGGAAAKMSGDPEAEFDLHRAKQLLVDREYQEVVTYSFISPEMHDLLDPGHGSVTLANPISADMSVMRTSLWPGLLQTALYNQSRQQSRIRIFESGLRFIKRGEAILQDPMLAGLICGGRSAEQWGEASAMVDFFDLKADLEAVLALTGCADGFGFEADEHPCLHPGQSAKVVRNDEIVGYIGMLHPEIEKKLGLNGNAFVFELRLDEKLVGRLPVFRALSKFPSIRRDIAIVLDREISFARVHDCIQRAAPQTLQSILLFDVYTGEKVDSGRKSIALGLILQETSHTLTDEEVERVMARVLQALADELDAQLRD
ncbi:MAG: phenylalanine--tRNA ligase subunit beta [Candidatus Sedimenticola endophacoides]|uniref:Phenylalanine--tRNA ligase beta subunit n=2 Tax=Candidatus Sedimenticola endophacoides TaxID=2548426 RepID=A0A6N4E309_9GAMM|nr:MAG: phenylalanine--tRNA ligase subunit beta [Candidatus Sedimenticola endophacoides]OQX34544.1 MAG: phenylalanine--tRNA ligase subunit beta [Candidatus Sedimenticola endophacoides]OQX41654.1 MAG: phenylalanine--tRNA ligase subunit beta [Candidatus Sedimenticola endophacoides]PUD98973.1 MAG: phenylalanine--tRNA ligase subunit beta [Candidatus Sedimenticola endophacoides]PUE02617.1 MAG: phenylalanine--tRNA ligase subunit beta [Candidatus Sedimenticola endophacoides]